jgi:hypothetical protein
MARSVKPGRIQSGVNASAMECVPSSGMGEQQAGHGIPAPPQSPEWPSTVTPHG